MDKQGYSDRKDESMSMRDGKESNKSQSFKSRRDESYGMKKTMGHASAPKKCNAFEAQRNGKNRGYPSQAMDYNY